MGEIQRHAAAAAAAPALPPAPFTCTRRSQKPGVRRAPVSTILFASCSSRPSEGCRYGSGETLQRREKPCESADRSGRVDRRTRANLNNTDARQGQHGSWCSVRCCPPVLLNAVGGLQLGTRGTGKAGVSIRPSNVVSQA